MDQVEKYLNELQNHSYQMQMGALRKDGVYGLDQERYEYYTKLLFPEMGATVKKIISGNYVGLRELKRACICVPPVWTGNPADDYFLALLYLTYRHKVERTSISQSIQKLQAYEPDYIQRFRDACPDFLYLFRGTAPAYYNSMFWSYQPAKAAFFNFQNLGEERYTDICMCRIPKTEILSLGYIWEREIIINPGNKQFELYARRLSIVTRGYMEMYSRKWFIEYMKQYPIAWRENVYAEIKN